MVHRPAEKMTHVDCLSRNIVVIGHISIEDELLYKQLADPRIKEIAETVEIKGSQNFTLIDGLVFRNYKNKNLFVVPENMVNNIIRIYHDDMEHVGIDKTIQGITGHYWFPCLKVKVRQYLDNCVTCLSYSIAAGKPEGELQIFEKETIPFNTLHIDHFGPLEATMDKYKHILVVIDAFTKFVWLFPAISTGSEEVIEILGSLFSTFGLPSRIISDRGTAFTSNKFNQFISEAKIKHVKIAVASPWANGQVKRVNRFLKSTLSKIVENPFEWRSFLGRVQYVINNTHNKAIDATPSKALLGYDQKRQLDEGLKQLLKQLQNIMDNYDEARVKTRNTAQIVNRTMQEYNKVRYDKRHKKCSIYKAGDLVLLRKLQNKPGENQKLVPKYKGPYQVKTVLNKNRYVIIDVPGYQLTQKPLNTIVSADKIKPWIHVGENVNTENSDEIEETEQSDT